LVAGLPAGGAAYGVALAAGAANHVIAAATTAVVITGLVGADIAKKYEQRYEDFPG